MKIVIVEQSKGQQNRFTAEHIKKINKAIPVGEVIRIDDTELASVLSDADILIIGSPLHKDVNEAKNLKWVQLTSAGANDWAEYLNDKDILLTNASGVHPIPIAEHILCYMLMFARGFTVTYRYQIIDKTWKRNGAPTEVAGKTMGIVGYGNIGRRTAELGKAMGMRVVALSHGKQTQDSFVDTFYPAENLPELLHESDFIINCLPFTKETAHYFSQEQFERMKSTSYFINIGRGATVNEMHLISALQNRTIAGAGLDVFEEEPLPDTSPLWQLENVIITPHNSGWTPEYMNRFVDIFIRNLKAFMKNEPMPTLVNKTLGY